MSWTDASTVESHLIGITPQGLPVNNILAKMAVGEKTQLPHRNIIKESFRVTAIQSAIPEGPIAVTLNGYNWASVGWQNLAMNSVVVAYDQTPYGRFIEGLDYAIDYEGGQVKRIPFTSISDSATVYVWFIPLKVFAETTDYEVDYANGTINHSETSLIADPAFVMIDYETDTAAVPSSLISGAITEAEDKILARLKDEYSISSEDQGLKTGATELSLSMICDDMALAILTQSDDLTAFQRAAKFMELAGRYEKRAEFTLSRFLKQPLKDAVKIKGNQVNTGW